MRRIKIIFAVLVAMATMLVASVAPALANDRHDDNDFRFHHFNDFRFHDFDEDFLFFSPFFFGFDNDCPFAGDFEGPVNQFDCFD
jgi:hypothetical protein